MPSSFLKAERERILSLIQQIRNSGTVAPDYCWLTETSSTKGAKTYIYMVLVTQKPDHTPKSQSLGRPGSARHRQWKHAIARRVGTADVYA